MKLNHLIIIGALCGALLLPSSASSWGVVGLSAGAGGGGGDTSPATRVPTGDGTDAAWVPSSGADNWAMVDDPVGTPDDATTYISAADANRLQLFTYTDFSVPSGSTIDSVEVVARSKRAGTYTVNLRHYVRVGGTNYYATTAHSMYDDYRTNTSTFTTNPATTNAWTVDEVNGVGTYALQEFGIGSLGMTAGETVHCTQVYIKVTFH